MTHFYLALNHLLAGGFEAALAATRRATDVGHEIAIRVCRAMWRG
jgi:hypothetical protein